MGLVKLVKRLLGRPDSDKIEGCPACGRSSAIGPVFCQKCHQFRFYLLHQDSFKPLPPTTISELTLKTIGLYLFLRNSVLQVFDDLMNSYQGDITTLMEKSIPLPVFEPTHIEKLNILMAFHLSCLAKVNKGLEKQLAKEVPFIRTGLLELYKSDKLLFLSNGLDIYERSLTSSNPDMFWAHTFTSMLHEGRCSTIEVRMGMSCFFGAYVEHAEILSELCLEKIQESMGHDIEEVSARLEEAFKGASPTK